MSQRFPSLRNLLAFDAAARHGNFSRAAAELHLSQGAMSHQIRQLETLLGCELFDREGRRIQLNAHGERYLGFVRQALDTLAAGAAAVAPAAADEHRLTVSVSPNFASKWLVPRLGDFLSTHPDIDLRISAIMRHIDFARDEVDVAVRHGGGDWPSLCVTKLADERIFPVISPHLVKTPGEMALTDIADYPLIHDQSRDHWQDWLATFNLPIPVRQDGPVFDQSAHAIDAAVAGHGVALARSELVALDLAAGRLVAPFEESIEAPFSYWIVHPKTPRQEGLIDRFKAWLLEAAS